MNKLKLVSILFLTAIITFSCSSDDDNIPIPLGDYEKGYFITNEGPFQNGSGTLTFVEDDGTVTQNIYKTVNNEDLGNIVQSMTIHNDKAYIVVNNSHKIVITNRYTMEKMSTIEGSDIENPRYFVAVGNTGYISNWGDALDASDDYIAVVNLTSNTITSKIPVGEGPEDMLVDGNMVYVNLQGGFGQNNKVILIDTTSNTVTSTIDVGDVPNSIVKDTDGNVWVLCGGNPSFTGSETKGGLAKIVNNTVTLFDFDDTEHPTHLSLDGNQLYYSLNGKVYTMSTTDVELPTSEISGLDGFYYSMKANNGKLYTTDAGNFSSEGTVKVFDLSTNTLETTFTAGIIPGSVVFQ